MFMSFFVYILRNAEDRFYIGHTSDLELRLRRHNEGRVRSTKGHGPWRVTYFKEFWTRAQAMANEKELKSLKSKEALHRLTAQRSSPERVGVNRQVVPTHRDLRSHMTPD